MKQTLNKGDIIIFKAENDWLSKAIAWFTQSDASHAAMAYSEDSIVEVGAYGIGVHQVNVSQGNDIYVMRLSSTPDPAPLIDSANNYLNAKVRYDFPALFILAGLLIYRRIVPTTKLLDLSYRILCVAGLMLDEMIQHVVLHHSDQAMVCSQLVYQIFYDCGGEYRIQIVDGCLQSSPISKNIADSVCLYDLLPVTKTLSDSFAAQMPANEKILPPSTTYRLTQNEMNELARELYTALCETTIQKTGGNVSLTKTDNSTMDHTLSAAENFLSKLEYFMKLIKCDMPLNAMFVTPGDLVYHAANLSQVETLSLKRIPAP